MTDDPNCELVLLCALPQESAPMLARLKDVMRLTPNGVSYRADKGRLGSRDVVLMRSGEGRASALKAVQWLDAHLQAVPLLAFGVAGAASEDLHLGDLVVAARVTSDLESEPTLVLPELRNPMLKSASAILEGGSKTFGRSKSATFATVHRPLISKSEKTAAWRQFQSSAAATAGGSATATPTDPVCVEMESYPVAQACLATGRPALFVRTISDTASERLPGLLARCRTPDGATDIAAVARQAALRPWTWGALLRLSGRVSRGSERLAALIEGALLGNHH